MNSKLDTSPAALRGLADDAHRAIADACSTGYIRMTVPVDEKRDTDRRIERAVAALRALADEKEGWIGESRAILDSAVNQLADWRVRTKKAEAEAAAMREALRYLVNQVAKCAPVDDHGHDFKTNRAYCEAVRLLDTSTAGRDLLARVERILSDRGILISMLRGMADATGESLDPEDEKVLQEIENDHAALRAAGYIIGTAEAAIRADQARRDAEIARETARRWRWGGRRNVNADFACDEIAAEIERRAGIGEEKSDD